MQLDPVLQRINSIKNEAEKLQPGKPESEKIFWDKYRLEFNYHSNHLEGNTLTYGHTQLLLLFDRVVADYSGREIEEMKAHDLALKIIKERALDDEDELSEKFIKEINEIILVRPFYKNALTPDGQDTRRLIEPGQYKKYSNSVLLENGEIFNYASPEETPSLMGDLIDWYREEEQNKELHAVQLAALFHYKFVRIHPFDDGNGRASRLIMNYILIKNGYAPLVIESDDKKNYLTALNKADVGDIGAFVDYITGIALYWQELYLKALREEKISSHNDFEKELKLLKQELKNSNDKIEFVFNRQILEQVFASSILPFINETILTLSKMDDLFVSKIISIFASGRMWSDIKAIDEFPIIFDAILKERNLRPFIFQFHYEHQKLKKESRLDFQYKTDIGIKFSEYFYEVYSESDQKTRVKKYYHQNLSTSEINELTQSVAKREIEIIKETAAM